MSKWGSGPTEVPSTQTFEHVIADRLEVAAIWCRALPWSTGVARSTRSCHQTGSGDSAARHFGDARLPAARLSRNTRQRLSNVRFGSEADIEAPSPDVRFTPKGDIAERNRHVRFVAHPKVCPCDILMI